MSKHDDQKHLALLLYLLHEKNTGACYILALSCHMASCRAHSAQQCLNKTRSIRPRPKLQDQDQNYKTKTEAGLRLVLS